MRQPPAEPDLCIVVPAYNEKMNLPILVEELVQTFTPQQIIYEVLIIDDGSHDASAEVIRTLVGQHRNVRGVLLSRNFGHQAAVSIGLEHARGRAVAVMDADLQDRPADLLALFRKWETEQADVVYAVRSTRRENLFKRLAYRGFYRALSGLANVEIPLDSGDFCVMSASFVARLNALPERLRFMRGLRAWLGGRQIGVPVHRDPRRGGRPQYTLGKLMALAIDGLVSFSYKPLRLASWAGALTALVAFMGVIVVLIWRFTGKLPPGSGVATIALGVLFLGGVQLLTIGILGEYVGRTFDEVKARPVAVIAEFVEPATATAPPPRPDRRQWSGRRAKATLAPPP